MLFFPSFSVDFVFLLFFGGEGGGVGGGGVGCWSFSWISEIRAGGFSRALADGCLGMDGNN